MIIKTFLRCKDIKQLEIKFSYFLCTSISVIISYLLSVERPAVAIREEELMKTKSLAVLLWHCQVCNSYKQQMLILLTVS